MAHHPDPPPGNWLHQSLDPDEEARLFQRFFEDCPQGLHHVSYFRPDGEGEPVLAMHLDGYRLFAPWLVTQGLVTAQQADEFLGALQTWIEAHQRGAHDC